jgi:flotillin
MLSILFSPIMGYIALAAVIFLIGLIYAKTVYKNAGADEALIITGRRRKKTTVDGVSTEETGIKVVHGSGVFLTPFFQKASRLSLTSRAIDISALAQDRNGVTLTVDAVAIVKVGEDLSAIRAAAQRFLGQEKNIDNFAQEVLSGSLRASIGATDVTTIIQKRDELGTAVLATARESLANQGVDVDSFEIKGITDDNGYIKDLGRAEQARVRLLAEVAETNAAREAKQASVAAEQAVAEAENTLALKRAALQLDTDKAAAEAAAARPLAEAKAQQAVVTEQEATAVRRAQLRKAELESEVNAIADADAYRVRVTSEAAAMAAVAKANGDRDARVAVAAALLAEGQAEADARIANSAAVRAEGEAQADAILARGKAEAESTKLSAEAVAQQSEALIQLRMVEMLPQIAHELAAPMSNIDNLTVISTDGASQLSKNVASGFSEVDGVLKSTMGLGIKDLLGSLVGGTAAGAAFGKATENGAKPLDLDALASGLGSEAAGAARAVAASFTGSLKG